jgi:hypothetical protein
MKKIFLLSLITYLSMVSTNLIAQTPLTLNLLCQINGEITGISSSPNPLTKVPISGSMSILVENGFIVSSDTNNYFSSKVPATIESDRIFGFAQWRDDDAENKLVIDVNRNTGMLRVSKEKTLMKASIFLDAKASGSCEKMANRRKF